LIGIGSAPSGAPPRCNGETGQAQKAARAVFVLLVVACIGAFVAAQRLKHTPAAVQQFKMNPSFTPVRPSVAACRGRVPKRLVNTQRPRIEYLSFKLAQADQVTAEIVDEANHRTAVLARDLPAERYKVASLCWNGRTGPRESGEIAPPGIYHLRVYLHEQKLTRESPPHTFELEAAKRRRGRR
jgi:hypothetical protein